MLLVVFREHQPGSKETPGRTGIILILIMIMIMIIIIIMIVRILMLSSS